MLETDAWGMPIEEASKPRFMQRVRKYGSKTVLDVFVYIIVVGEDGKKKSVEAATAVFEMDGKEWRPVSMKVLPGYEDQELDKQIVAYVRKTKHVKEDVIDEMRTKELIINGKKTEGVLVAGGQGFKIYTASGIDGWVLVLGRKTVAIHSVHPESKIVGRYVNLRYHDISQQEQIKKDFDELIKKIALKEEMGSLMLPDREKNYKTLQGK